MSFNISYKFQAIDDFSPVTKKIQSNIEKISAAAETLGNKMQSIGNRIKSAGQSLTLSVTAPLAAIGGLSLKAAADQEKVNMQLENLIGNAEKAAALSEDLEKIKMSSPIDVSAIDDAALRLITMGQSVDKVASTLQNFAKISAGTGIDLTTLTEYFAIAQSGPQGMSRALLALNKRVPVLIEMQKIFKEKFNMNLSLKEIQKLAAEGRIGISMLEESFARLTREGGRFSDSIAKQSNTLSGALQLIKNNFARFEEAIGFAIMGAVDLTGATTMLNEKLKGLVSFVEEFAQANPEITKYIVIFAAIAAAVGPLLVGLGYAVIGLGGLAKVFVFMLSPIGLIITGITAVGATFLYLYNKFELVRNAVKSVINYFVELYQTAPILTTAYLAMRAALIMLYRYKMLGVAGIVAYKYAAIAWGAIMSALPAILAGARTAVLLFNLALRTNPIGLVIVALTTLGSVIGFVMAKLGYFDGIIDAIKSKITSLIDIIKSLFSFDFGKVGSAFASVTGFGNTASAAPLINNVSLGSQSISSESRTQVDINLKGNTEAVRSVQSTGDKSANVNVSQNMGYGAY